MCQEGSPLVFCVLMFKTIKMGFQLPPHEDVSAKDCLDCSQWDHSGHNNSSTHAISILLLSKWIIKEKQTWGKLQ